MKYQCDECHGKFATIGNLKFHEKLIHENIKYQCERCNYKSATQGNLKNHKRSIH